MPVTDGGTDFWNWCNGSTDNYGGCGVDVSGYFVRRAFGSAVFPAANKSYAVRFNCSPLDGMAVTAGTA